MPTEPLRVGDRVRYRGQLAVFIIEYWKLDGGPWCKLRCPSGHLTGWLRPEGLERVES